MPLVGWARVRHARLRPVRHAFDYPSLFIALPLRSMRERPAPSMPRNRLAPIAFHDADHGAGGGDALAWLESFLAAAGIRDADGEIWLQCFPRVLGFAFKPVSFWFCERGDGSLRAIVCEVNNTFGERHFYLLDEPSWGREMQAPKVFHVSPFCEVRGVYRFRFLRSACGTRWIARIDLADEHGPLLQTSMSGRLQVATAGALRLAFLRFPFLTLGIVARIHWHALRLWLARLPVHPHRAHAAPHA